MIRKSVSPWQWFMAIIVAMFLVACPASAQQATNGGVISSEEQIADDPDAWIRILDNTEQAVRRDGVTDNELNRLFDEMGTLRDAALLKVRDLQPEVADLKSQLEKLGPPPAEGETPETEAVANNRSQLNESLSEAESLLKEVQVSELRANQLRTRIADIRNERFVSSISKRTEGLLTGPFWSKFTSGFASLGIGMELLISQTTNLFGKRIAEDFQTIIVLFLMLGAILWAFTVMRKLLKGLGKANEHEPGQGDPERSPASAFLYYLRNGILPAVAIYLVYWALSGLGLLAFRFEKLASGIALVSGFAIIAATLMRLCLLPRLQYTSLVTIEPRTATRLVSVISTTIIILSLLVLLELAASLLVTPLETNVGLSLMFALVVGGTILWTMNELRRDRNSRLMQSEEDPQPNRLISLLYGFLWVIGLIIIGAALAGYVALADFLAEQVLFGLVVILTAWLLVRFADYLFYFRLAVKPATKDGKAATSSGDPLITQSHVLGAGLFKMAVVLAATFMMLVPWGFRSSDFLEVLHSLFYGIEVGGLSLSFSAILIAILVFFVGYFVTVTIRNWLRVKYLPTTHLDSGLSNSISTMFGYAGFVIAVLFAVTAAGFELSNLAIVAGALSVGVGFGLQSIVNNFVSGLILLAERPIKVGDWVETTGGNGYVKKISVRSTEIETFDRATVIVPNSSLITDNVTNWTHENKTGRIIVGVGVGYDSDPDQVQEILLACAADHPRVLGRPAPAVYFMDFGASSLDFELRCFLGDINYALSVSSELRFEILKALRKANIEIPFPQRDLNIKTQVEAVVQPTEKKPARRSRSASSKSAQ